MCSYLPEGYDTQTQGVPEIAFMDVYVGKKGMLAIRVVWAARLARRKARTHQAINGRSAGASKARGTTHARSGGGFFGSLFSRAEQVAPVASVEINRTPCVRVGGSVFHSKRKKGVKAAEGFDFLFYFWGVGRTQQDTHATQRKQFFF